MKIGQVKIRKVQALGLCSLLLLGACAATPLGPTVQVMPDPNKPFPVFAQDQSQCEQFAQSQVAGQASAANTQVLSGALLATALGTAPSGGSTQDAQSSIQQNYNNAYVQCMYSRGNQIPSVASSQ
jgi:hypothetical protein